MKGRHPGQRKRSRSRSPKNNSPRSQLMKNQEHPFQPHHSNINRPHEENIPYQSIKHSIPTVNPRPAEVMMVKMGPQQGSFHGEFPNDELPHYGGQHYPSPQPNFVSPAPFYPTIPNTATTPIVQPAFPLQMAQNPMNVSPSAFPQPQPLTPNPLNIPSQPSLDPVMAAAGQNFFQQLGGFNVFYYNALDPALAIKKNTPIPVPASKHWLALAGTILVVASIVVMAIGLGKFLQTSSAAGIVCAGVAMYIILGVICSPIRKYIFNLKKLADFQALYNRMRQARSYFVFSIECYHYVTTTRRTKRGTSTHRSKVVTHTARREFDPSRCQDDSGEVSALKIYSHYAFVKYLKRFYFADPASEARFISAFNQFVASNRRDTHQDYRYEFQVAGFEEDVGFSQTGQGQHSRVLFILFSLFLLAYPYSLWIQNSVSRFQVNLLKRLTV